MNTRDLRVSTGALALAFGIYCLALAAWVIAAGISAFPLILGVLIALFGVMYLFFGILTLRKKRNNAGLLVFAVAFFSTGLWPGAIPWYFLPLFIVPWVLLALGVVLLLRGFRA